MTPHDEPAKGATMNTEAIDLNGIFLDKGNHGDPSQGACALAVSSNV